MIVAETCWMDSRKLATIALQWGRDLIVAETGDLKAKAARSRWLQWGRDLIVAETRDGCWHLLCWLACFNGAAT